MATDLSQAIANKAQGSYQTMVKLSDGTITSLADFTKTPAGRTISLILNGAYRNQAVNNGTGAVLDLANAVKTSTADKVSAIPVGGAYNNVVQIAGDLVYLSAKIDNANNPA